MSDDDSKSDYFSTLDRRAFLLASASFLAACAKKDLIKVDANAPVDATAPADATALVDASVPVDASVDVSTPPPAFVFSDYPFKLGVASGEPYHDSVVLWTRLAPQPFTSDGGMPNEDIEVKWTLSLTEDMQNIVQSGIALATFDLAHSVHIEVTALQPDLYYWYQFEVAGITSTIGRTRTMPASDASVEKLKFAFTSCQHFEYGYFTAYKYIAEDEPDLIIHLGDYIYEHPAKAEQRVRSHQVRREIFNLADYRIRYAEYKMDPDLQAAHAIAPWLLTHDDHEVDNNYVGMTPKYAEDEGSFLERRTEAYKAYFEHMPFRLSMAPGEREMRVYRQIDFGNLISFYILDTRQYRSDQPCEDGVKAACPEMYSEQATVLGEQQEQWLFDSLLKSKSAWNVLAQQVMMAPVDRIKGSDVGFNMDSWAGYEVSRKKIINFLDQNKISNPVVLTGDLHTNWVNELKVDYSDPAAKIIATEFVGTSITTGGDKQIFNYRPEQLMKENSFVKFFNQERGYVYCEVTRNEWRTDFKVLETVARKNTKIEIRASFILTGT